MKIKHKKGISLIVLVITIIVMIILAAAIILSLQSSGIIDKANTGKRYSDISNAKAIVGVKQAEWLMMSETDKSEYNYSFATYVSGELEKNGYKIGNNEGEYEVLENGEIYIYPKIPDGFIVSGIDGENKVSQGLVVYNIPEGTIVDWEKTSEGDTTMLDVHEFYDQYVWIPVDNINDFVRKEGYNQDGLQDTLASGDSTEPLSKTTGSGITLSLENDLTGEHAEYAAMRKSVEKYGGFYIGRYEAGDAEVNEKRTGITEVHKVVVRKNMHVYNFATWGKSSTDVSLYSKNDIENVAGAVWLARSVYPKEENYSVVSTLCYGVQWDAAIDFMKDIDNVLDNSVKYIQNSTGMGWYYDSYRNANLDMKTGIELNIDINSDGNYEYLATNKVKNIYDMAGNVMEWTMEASNALRFYRGGYWGSWGNYSPASNRTRNLTTMAYDRSGFRPALYIK